MKAGLKRLGFLTLGFAISGCGSSSDGPTSTNGGVAGTAGAAGNASGGNAGTSAGSSTGGSSGGLGGSPNGGSAGATSSVVPNGVANICTGAGCPYGKCDNNTMAPSCTSVYPGPVGGSAMLCKGDGQYCLVTGADGNFDFWAVTCTGTVSSAQKCQTTCGFNLITATANCS
ncbi:MAG TPA: hypothetical protein VHW01_24765 [Polyangiaceae bacterium]|jgi:hypothetical protein|nr:hypothetical protein [Polyangiaceae bacterium]